MCVTTQRAHRVRRDAALERVSKVPVRLRIDGADARENADQGNDGGPIAALIVCNLQQDADARRRGITWISRPAHQGKDQSTVPSETVEPEGLWVCRSSVDVDTIGHTGI